ncbi:MAG: isocitrate/isopropylmalate dehydrogenase family protein [Armatimonadetes bacterium]|nr:isocitrate/isopropylmalate dehydrogenase family protein [Armatimonadota bacterium]
MRSYHIAVLPGDGIGPEVVAEGLKVLRRAEALFGGFRLECETLAAGARCYLKEGDPLPPHTLERAHAADAIYLGAMGDPAIRYPDGTELAPQVTIRFALDLYAGIRPARLYPGVPPVLTNRQPINFVVVRESTEGLFASMGGGSVLREETAVDTQVITRRGTERVVRAAFELARQRGGRRKVTCVDKANIFKSFAFFRRVFAEVAREYPDVEHDFGYVDAIAMKLVLAPEQFDVLVTENMFGDILSDLAAGIVGGLGMAPSADIGDAHAVFQPCHGTAPDIAGKGIANPLAAILSAAMMLAWLGERRADAALRQAGAAIERAVAEGLSRRELLGPDLGGARATPEIGARVAALLEPG